MAKTLVISNVRYFYEIANEAFDKMNDDMGKNIKLKPNGNEGFIKTYDPQHKSFKNALITIVFAGVYLESLMHLLIVEKNDIVTYEKYDRKVYEGKLKLLGCNDSEILELCSKYRASRKEIVHEKAHLDNGKIKMAQAEAIIAMSLVNKINEHFNISMG